MELKKDRFEKFTVIGAVQNWNEAADEDCFGSLTTHTSKKKILKNDKGNHTSRELLSDKYEKLLMFTRN